MLLEQRGTKLCQRFFPFFIALFSSFMFVMFSVLDRLFIKCKYFLISSSGGAQVYVKKIIGLQGNADNSSKIDYL